MKENLKAAGIKPSAFQSLADSANHKTTSTTPDVRGSLDQGPALLSVGDKRPKSFATYPLRFQKSKRSFFVRGQGHLSQEQHQQQRRRRRRRRQREQQR